MAHLKLVAALCVLLAFVVVSDAAAPACLSPSGKVVSWWFIHKEKADDTSSYKTWGYADASTSYSYARSDDENSGKNALFTSQTAIFKAPHFLSYNDEPGPSTRAHEKGWIGWDDNSGTGSWIIHSVPLWNEDTDLPSHKYGQSFLCITLGSTDAVTSALQALLDTRVAVQGGCDGASHSSSANKMASSVCHMDDKSPRGGNTEPTLNQALGGGFFLFSKPPYANTDVWTLIAEAIGSKLLVSTWRRYNGDDDQFTKSVTDVECMSPDAIDKDATPACPSQGNDHGKYGISVGGDWVCVGGNNREVSQFKRGGLAVCFKNKGLHNKLSTLISAAGCASSSLTATVKGFASALGELISNAISEVLPTN